MTTLEQAMHIAGERAKVRAQLERTLDALDNYAAHLSAGGRFVLEEDVRHLEHRADALEAELLPLVAALMADELLAPTPFSGLPLLAEVQA